MNVLTRILMCGVGGFCVVVAFFRFLPNKDKLRYALLTLVLGIFFLSCGLLASPPERIACWCLGVTLLFFAVAFLKEDEKSYSFACLLIAALFCMCGQLWVQRFLENGLVGTFNLKVNAFQQTLDDYRQQLGQMQSENITNQRQLNILQKDIVTQQKIIADAESKIADQYKETSRLQDKLTSAEDKITHQIAANETIQASLEEAQVKLTNQETQLKNVENTVAHIYDNMKAIELSVTNTNAVAMVHLGKNAIMLGFILPDVPVPNSIEVWRQAPSRDTMYLLPEVTPLRTINFNYQIFTGSDFDDYQNNIFFFKYVRDPVATERPYRTITTTNNRFVLDGHILNVPHPDYGRSP